MKQNDKVLMRVGNAKWYLDHPEIYSNGITWHSTYEEETIIHLMCAIGAPVFGKVLRANSSGDLEVIFRIAGLTAQYWVEHKHITKVLE